jgi:hypothetical protein
MIVEYIRYKIDPARTDEFDDAYRRAGELMDASPHCLPFLDAIGPFYGDIDEMTHYLPGDLERVTL